MDDVVAGRNREMACRGRGSNRISRSRVPLAWSRISRTGPPVVAQLRTHHAPPDGDQQFVLEMAAQARQRAAHCRLTEIEPVAGGDVALVQQGVEGDQQVQIEEMQVHSCGPARRRLDGL